MKPCLVVVCGILFALSMMLSGCTQSATVDQRFVGSWKGTLSYISNNKTTSVPANITFFSDGTYQDTLPVRGTETGNWTINGSNVTLSFPMLQYAFSFSANKNRLEMRNLSAPYFTWNITRTS